MQPKHFLTLLISFFTSSCLFFFSTGSTAQNTQQKFENADAFNQGFSGLMVKDLEKDEVIYERFADKYFTPASNIKLFTFYTGLKVLEDSIPGLRYWVKQDSLIFTGTGDPSFLNPELPDSRVFEFLKERNEKLFYLPSEFAEEHYGPGWAWDDYNSSYSPERANFPIYGNLVTFNFLPNGKIPYASPRIFQDSLQIRDYFGDPRVGIRRHLDRNIFSFQTTSGVKNRPSQKLPFRYSHQLLADLLSDTLRREVKILKTLPPGTGDPSTVYSVPADSLYKRMLQKSDNFIAEQILLLSAHQLKNIPRADVSINYMKKEHLKDLPDKIHWVDGSGLSRYNLVTPRSMVALLEKITEEIETEKLFDLLATGGKSGTLKYYYWAKEPYVFAKTGTLLHNHSMSGYLKTRSGKILVFSFMNSNHIVPTRQLKRQMEIILRDFRDNY